MSMLVAAGAAALLLGLIVTIPHAASATAHHTTSPTQFGTISNFDVFNDTGQETEGFEIELDGVSPADVTYTFGAPYQRYGNPTITPFAGGVYVRYEAPWDAASHKFTVATPVAATPIQATAGHQCWTGGSASYPTMGCEHFGLGLTVNPTNVVYHWLVADPAHPGNVVTFGGGVPIPAPQWSATPPPPGNPNPQPIVGAVAPAPPPEQGQQLGDAVWVKVYMHQRSSPSDLNHLLDGDSQVPVAAEVETEWLLIQAGSNSLQTELANEGQLAPKSESVVRKYQFFQYTGPYDAENHEALPVSDSQPSAGELGNLIGNQMAGLNLAPNGKVPGDRVRPKAFFVKKPAAKVTSTTATFKFRATDNVSKKFNYFCSLDKKIPAPCTNPVTYKGLAKGAHSLSVYSIDQADNPSKAVAYKWTVK
jgi:hypothetical protein